MSMLVKLVLRSETQITINRQDSAFVVFMHTGVPNSLAESTCKVAQSWHEMKSKTAPERLTSPIRVLLFQHLAKTVMEQFERMVHAPSSRSSEMELGLLTHNEEAQIHAYVHAYIVHTYIHTYIHTSIHPFSLSTLQKFELRRAQNEGQACGPAVLCSAYPSAQGVNPRHLCPTAGFTVAHLEHRIKCRCPYGIEHFAVPRIWP